MSNIPYGRQCITQEDINAVVDVLQSDWITQGPTLNQFEQTVAQYCNTKYAVAVNSATSALHIACLAAGLGKNDILWTSPNTFVASANCGVYCGSKVDFVDIDEQTYNMDAENLEQKLRQTRKIGALPKVVIPVHFSGQSCDMKKIRCLADEFGFLIIEDASHAIGGKYLDTMIGSCQFSDMTVFSFHPVKIVTTGEGGMVLTNSEDLYKKLLLLRTHGITRDESQADGEFCGDWDYQQITLGYNYRMTDIQAALGLSQMKKIEQFITRRNEIARYYNEKLKKMPLVLPYILSENYSAFHLYVVKLQLEVLHKSRKQIFSELRQAGIGVNVHYIPVHTQPYYKKMGFKQGDFPVAESYYEQVLSLPIYYSLTRQEQDYVIECLDRIVK